MSLALSPAHIAGMMVREKEVGLFGQAHVTLVLDVLAIFDDHFHWAASIHIGAAIKC
jgi:hypothetical protein